MQMCIQFYFNINKVLDVLIQKWPVGAEAESESLEAKMTDCLSRLALAFTLLCVCDVWPLPLDPLADLTGSQDDNSLLPIDQGWWWGFPLVFVLRQKKKEWKRHSISKSVLQLSCYLHGTDSIHLSTLYHLKWSGKDWRGCKSNLGV